MSFYGKEYKLDRQENFDAFINALPGVPEDFKSVLISYKPTLKVVKDGDNYTLYSSNPDNTIKEATFQDGVEFDETVPTGRTSKTTYTVAGNTITQVQKFDDGSLTTKRVFSDNEVVVTITRTGWDGVSTRYYKAV